MAETEGPVEYLKRKQLSHHLPTSDPLYNTNRNKWRRPASSDLERSRHR